MQKVAFEISHNSIQASSSYAGPSVCTGTLWNYGFKSYSNVYVASHSRWSEVRGQDEPPGAI